ncbi:MAG: sugar transferase [Hymenobacteraceae bacterium]|nr:sugar transferase [Hymenobacteraceae bacterium]
MERARRNFQLLKLLLADFGAALLAWVAFFGLRRYLLREVSGGVPFKPDELFSLGFAAVAIGLFWLGLYGLFGHYRGIFRKSRVRELVSLGQVAALGCIIVFFALLLDDEGVHYYRAYYKTVTAYFLLHFICALVARLLVVTSIQGLVLRREIAFNTLLIGANARAAEVYQELEAFNRHLGLRFVGYVPVFDTPDPHLPRELRNLGFYTRLPELVAAHRIEEVIIAIEPAEHKTIEEILGLLDEVNVRVSILPDLYQILLGSVKVSHLFGTPLIEIKQDLLPVWQAVTKRVIDVVASALFLVLFSPGYAAVALMVRWSSPGPIFYGQQRIGLGGEPFKIWKFRSMYVDAERAGPALSSDHDPRITPWGRFMRKVRLDELPQFWNVVRGEMSLVGPRPERQFFIDQILQRAPHYRHLQRVRPGITSLGQVKYGYASTVEEMVKRLRYDILYIENMSLAMDFRVMLFTIKIILQGRGK